MTIYERIKSRRKQLGLSADDVAAALGISRATVYRYESADIENMGIDKIAPLAVVLQTTPGWILGWDSAKPLRQEETTLLEHFGQLNPLGEREAIKRVRELTYINEYKKTVIRKETPYTAPILMAAHGDDEEDIALIRQDLEEL